MNRVLMVAGALLAAVGLDVLTGADVPGRMAAFALASTFTLVFGAKGLAAAGLARPAGQRPGEHEEDEDA